MVLWQVTICLLLGNVLLKLVDAAAPPYMSQVSTKLIGPGFAGSSSEGAISAMSGDGSTAIVCDYADNSYQGACWIWINSGSSWVSQTPSKLVATPSSGPGTRQGFSCGISANGNVAVVGAVAQFASGVFYIWYRTGTTWSQQGGGYFIPSSLFGSSYVGYSVAVSGDASTIAVGSPYDSSTSRGVVWIYTRTGPFIWAEQANLRTCSSDYCRFGASSSLSLDGNTLAVGAISGGDIGIGKTWIFKRSGSSWVPKSNFFPNYGNSYFYSILAFSSISGDGRTVAIGLPASFYDDGGVWVFYDAIGDGTGFAAQSARLLTPESDGAGGQVGSSVALSHDGNVLAASAPKVGGGKGGFGIFTRDGVSGAWVPRGPLLSGTESGPQSRSSVSLSSDGQTVIESGSTSGGSTGAAWIFHLITSAPSVSPTRSPSTSPSTSKPTTSPTRSPTSSKPTSNPSTSPTRRPSKGPSSSPTAKPSVSPTNKPSGTPTTFRSTLPYLSQVGDKLVGSDQSAPSGLGSSSAISGDGRTAIVCGFGDASYTGACWVWIKASLSAWTLQTSTKLVAAPNSGDSGQGYSCGISHDGNIAVVGAHRESSFVGAFYIWYRTGTSWSQEGGGRYVPSIISGAPLIGISIAISGDASVIAVGGYFDDGYRGAVWLYHRTGTFAWTEQVKLQVCDAAHGCNFGNTVSLSYDGQTLAASGYSGYYNVGNVWIYKRIGSSWTLASQFAPTGVSNAATFVGISGDGKTVALGVLATWTTDIGGVWVYHDSTGDGTNFVPQGSRIFPTDGGSNPRFGRAVALSHDGTVLLATGEDAFSKEGGIWMFTRDDTNLWTQQGPRHIGTGNAGAAGQGVSGGMSSDGNMVIVGGLADAGYTGAAWIFKAKTMSDSPTVSPSYSRPSASPTAPLSVGSVGGDPHYIMLDNTAITCNGLGWNVLASGAEWQVQVNHFLIPGGSGGTSIDQAKVVFSNSAPQPEIVFGPGAFTDGTYNANTPYEVVIASNSVTLTAMGTTILVSLLPSFMNLGVASSTITGGILVDGCPDATPVENSAAPQIACVNAGLQEPFLSMCNYDYAQSNGNDEYVTAAVSYAQLVEDVQAIASTGAPTTSPVAFSISK